MNSLTKVNNPSIIDENEKFGEIFLPEFQEFQEKEKNFQEEENYINKKLQLLQNKNINKISNFKKKGEMNFGDFTPEREEGEHKYYSFKTIPDIKNNASLQIRKIKFYWRGTQTNLPYIFKKLTYEKNDDENCFDLFEQHDYSKKKIKTTDEDEN